jgi:hypothetical protein
MTDKEAFVSVSRVKAFLECLTVCPHIIPANIGAEAFVAEIEKGSKALAEVLKRQSSEAQE